MWRHDVKLQFYSLPGLSVTKLSPKKSLFPKKSQQKIHQDLLALVRSYAQPCQKEYDALIDLFTKTGSKVNFIP